MLHDIHFCSCKIQTKYLLFVDFKSGSTHNKWPHSSSIVIDKKCTNGFGTDAYKYCCTDRVKRLRIIFVLNSDLWQAWVHALSDFCLALRLSIPMVKEAVRTLKKSSVSTPAPQFHTPPPTLRKADDSSPWPPVLSYVLVHFGLRVLTNVRCLGGWRIHVCRSVCVFMCLIVFACVPARGDKGPVWSVSFVLPELLIPLCQLG